MDETKIITNHVPRPVIYGYELSPKERAKFTYYDDALNEIDERRFFRYKGLVYDLSEFMRVTPRIGSFYPYWHGYMSDSFFSGILVRYVEEDFGDSIIVGWYYC